jgi:hypothetical protein
MPNRSSAARRFGPEPVSSEEISARRFGAGFAGVPVLVATVGVADASVARFFSLASADLRTANTVLHALHRTRTPRSDTFSSATRKRDWQLGHWTTTTHCRRREWRLTRRCQKDGAYFRAS